MSSAPGDPAPAKSALSEPALREPALREPALSEPAAGLEAGSLPVMPGFREMALRGRADEQAARMAEDRGRLVRELAEQRQAAGLSQTEVAARMGTSQSAVARLESGTADVRASTLERYAAAVGGQITWKLDRPSEGVSE
jgi:ribosome-binding protein aMBF1 (putative translation factor)